MSDSSTITTGLLLKVPDPVAILAAGRSTAYELIRNGQPEAAHICCPANVTTASVGALAERF